MRLLERVWRVDEKFLARKGNWLWWWWIFYFREPKENPKQLMVLWSAKNEEKIHCNGLDVELRHEFVQRQGKSLNVDGAVAAWYYDGKKMQENYLLDHAPILVEPGRIRTDDPKTEFKELKSGFRVSLRGHDFRVGPVQTKGFYAPEHRETRFLFNRFSYDILKITRAPFTSSLGGGTAYFQRVAVNAPAPPWYWGVYHFEKGGCAHYYEPHAGKTIFSNCAEESWRVPIRKHFQFFDGEKVFDSRDSRVKRIDGENPLFEVNSQGRDWRARMLVEAYSSASWKFSKNALSRLTYNEYPCLVKEFSLKNRSGEVTLDDLGAGYGNSEHATGLLW